ncbi:MAG: uroporphyrinogen decarboxylase [Deltaproteobacteria bacterium]|nr:uroporphyrinogen decarboxylase [Deltaproteobacteria bacterium]
MNVNEKFQNALHRKPQKTPPIWLMRQAGRYHSHYRALREKHSFVDLCKVPELAAETARGPVAEFDFDLAILFSDLLFPLEALGMPLEYGDGGPQLGWQLSRANISTLKSPDDAFPDLKFQGDAVRATREVLPKDKSLIGFVGGAFTLFSYAMGCRRSDRCEEAKREWPLFEDFAREYLIPLTRAQIELQLKAGAEVVMILDPLAGVIGPQWFRERYLPMLSSTSDGLSGATGYYLRGASDAHLTALATANLPLAGVGFDHRFEMKDWLGRFQKGFVQGNFEEALLFLSPKELEQELERYFAPIAALSPQNRLGWVCGLGHGVLPKTPEENVRLFVQKARAMFA